MFLFSDAGTVKNNKRPKHKNPICVSDHLSHTCVWLSAEHPVLQCLSLELKVRSEKSLSVSQYEKFPVAAKRGRNKPLYAAENLLQCVLLILLSFKKIIS